MSIIDRKIATFSKKISDRPMKERNQGTNIKLYIETPSNELRSALNGAIDDIVADYDTKVSVDAKIAPVATNSQNALNQTNSLTDTVEQFDSRITTAESNSQNAITKTTVLEGRFNQLIINEGDSNAEIVAARVKADGTTFTSLPNRLNAADADFESHKSDYAQFNSQVEEQFISKSKEIKLSEILTRGLKSMSIPKNSLMNAQKAIINGTLKIAIWGDSILAGGDLNNQNDTVASKLIKSLQKNLPNVTIISQNFSLGARTLAQAASDTYVAHNPESSDLSNFWRSWATEGKSWRDHIKYFQPNLLIVGFGMNDAWGNPIAGDKNFATNLQSLIDYVNTWAVIPSIVIVPTILPTKVEGRYNQRQDVTNSVARAARAIAIKNKLAISDANRLFQLLRDGIDDVDRSSNYEKNFLGYPALWSGDKDSFTLSGNVMTQTSTNKFIKRNRIFYNGKIDLIITPSVSGDNGALWIKYRDSDIGNITLTVSPGTSGGISLFTYYPGIGYAIVQQVLDLNIPVGSTSKITIEAYDDLHKIYLNDVLKLQVNIYAVLNDGNIQFGSTNTCPVLSNITINFEDCLTGLPSFTETDLLGNYGDVDQGNGLNHPTALGHAVGLLPPYYEIIKVLSDSRETGMFTPKRILSSVWIAAGSNSTAGEKLWFTNLGSILYKKNRGVKLRRLDTGEYYTLSTLVSAVDTISQLESGKFAYIENYTGVDLIYVSVPANGSVTWDMDLFKYE